MNRMGEGAVGDDRAILAAGDLHIAGVRLRVRARSLEGVKG